MPVPLAPRRRRRLQRLTTAEPKATHPAAQIRRALAGAFKFRRRRRKLHRFPAAAANYRHP